MEARRREASQKSGSGHHGAERRWDKGKHARHHHDLQVVPFDQMVLVAKNPMLSIAFFSKKKFEQVLKKV